MKFSLASAFVVALAAQNAVASSWFSKAAYNKWHETELERWLSDHNIPYPTPADRKDLENLIKSNWEATVESPYLNYDLSQLQKQAEAQGNKVSKSAAKNKDELIKSIKSTWTESVDSANTAYGDSKTWLFDSWTTSSLKAFADKHGIPVPQPRKRDQLIKAVRENYQTAADKVSETVAYPGNWLYQQWSDSDLKAWLDERGIPAPQPTNRDKLIAAVRRNSRVASLNAQKLAAQAADSVSSSFDSTKSNAADAIINSWSESQLKEFFDKNGIKVPQGSTKNELVAIARKYGAKITGDNVSDSAAKAYGAATSSAGNQYSKATDAAYAEATGVADQVKSYAYHYFTEAQIALGLQTNYASSVSRAAASASKSASSAYAKASKSIKAEL